MIIDMHTHANGHVHKVREEATDMWGFQDWISRHLVPRHPFLSPSEVQAYQRGLSPEKFIAEMDEAGIDKSLILASFQYLSDDYLYETYVKKYPDRTMAFSGAGTLIVDRWGRFNKNAIKDFEKAVKEYGFRGVKVLNAYMKHSPSDSIFYPLYEKAVELGAPYVTIHQAGTPVASALSHMQYARPAMLEPLADDFPDLNIIIAHMGYPWTEELLSLMEKNKNIYTDFSHLCVHLFMLTWYLVMAKDYKVLDRVMFGTDTTCRPPKYYVQFVKTGLNKNAERAGWPTFTNEEINNLLGENAARLLKMNR